MLCLMNGLCGLLEGSLSDISTSEEESDPDTPETAPEGQQKISDHVDECEDGVGDGVTVTNGVGGGVTGLCGLLEGSLSDISTSEEESDPDTPETAPEGKHKISDHVDECEDGVGGGVTATNGIGDGVTVTNGVGDAVRGGVTGTDAHCLLEECELGSLQPGSKSGTGTDTTGGLGPVPNAFAAKTDPAPIGTTRYTMPPLRSAVDVSKIQKTDVANSCNVDMPLPADSVETVPVGGWVRVGECE